MEYWHPMPQALAVDLLAHRWTTEHPAPEAVGFMVALDRMRSGHAWSIRRLARWAGWTNHRARRVREEAKAYLSDWEAQTRAGHSRRTPTANNPEDLHGSFKQISHKKRTIPHITRADLQSQSQSQSQYRTDQPDGRDRDRSDRAREHEQTRTARRPDLDLDYQDHGEHITTAEAESFLELLSARTPSAG